MSLRVTKVAQVPFLGMGNGLTETQEEKRKNALLSEFRSLCPHAKSLQTSVLETRIDVRNDGTFFEYWLKEAPQGTLVLANGTPLPILGVGNDMFAADVTMVTQELHATRALIRTAVNPAIPLDLLRERSAVGDQIRFIRRRLRKREAFFLPTLDGEPIEVARATQRFIGAPVVASVRAHVSALFRRSVELAGATFIDEVPQQLGGVDIPARVLMARRSASKMPDLLMAFGGYLDSGTSVELQVGVNLDWITGAAVSLNFLEFLDASA